MATKASSVIITDADAMQFILQRKDNTHPKVQCRGLLGLFGGEAKGDESPVETLRREVGEEVLDPEICATIEGSWQHFESEELLGRHFPGFYELTTFVSRVPDEKFELIAERMADRTCVVEGFAQLTERHHLVKLLRNPRLFLASQDEPLRRFLSSL